MDRATPNAALAAIDYLLIGGGLAGAMAAEAIRERGAGGRVVIVTDDSERPYHRPPLSKEFLRGDQERKEVFVHSTEWYNEHGVEVMTSTRAIGLDPQAHTVTLDDGRTLHYKKLLLATGGTPKHLDIPGRARPLKGGDDDDRQGQDDLGVVHAYAYRDVLPADPRRSRRQIPH